MVLQSNYDFIVCGSGSSGSVIARRLAENTNVSVLLIEAGGSDDVPEVRDLKRWQANLGSKRDWSFMSEPNAGLDGRSMRMSMGKVLGGGSSINVGRWARGHKSDWDFFADEAGDADWNYESVLEIYRRVEDWGGEPDPLRRGLGGPLYVQPGAPTPTTPAIFEAARSRGIPVFPDTNGAIMEGAGGCGLNESRARDGQRLSVFRDYLGAHLNRPNLTVFTHAVVQRVILVDRKAVGVVVLMHGEQRTFLAGNEVILSLGAINTPCVLMRSGIGDEVELNRLGLPTVQHLPGVGRNLQDHLLIMSLIWERADTREVVSPDPGIAVTWKSDASLPSPDILCVQADGAVIATELAGILKAPQNAWSMVPGIVRPVSRGRVRLAGARLDDKVEVETNYLSAPQDMKAMLAAVALCQALAVSAPLAPFLKPETTLNRMTHSELEAFVRNSATTYWHESCTAKMGRDGMSVVDGHLKVYGIENLRIADASVMPRVTTGNTMAPCVVIGERAAEILRSKHSL